METIITLLIVLLPFVFKLIGKALENASAGQSVQPQSQAVPDIVDPVPERPVYQSVARHQEAPATERQEGESAIDRTTMEPVHTDKASTEDKPKQKLDPKKLIVYSEIMKPKF